MKCIVCGNDKFELIHHGTRDIKNVDVYKCCLLYTSPSPRD